MARSIVVAVIGDACVERGSAADRFAEDLGRRLVDAGCCVLTGGLCGVMEAACRGARSSARWTAGATVGLLPGLDPEAANPWVDLVLPTGLGHGRNALVAQADAVVAVGGGAGTLTEMGFAWISSRLLLAWRGGGWSGRLADTRIDERIRWPDIPEDRVYGVDTAEETLALLERYLPRYRRGVSPAAG